MSELGSSSVVVVDEGYGRIEWREYFLETDIDWLSMRMDWVGLRGVGMVKSCVLEKNVLRCETRYFVSSLVDVDRFADVVRRHWFIENQLHWRFDVAFGEDSARMCKDCSSLNWNVMRKTVLPLLRNVDVGEKTISIKRKMFMAALDVTILEKILF